RAPEAQEHGRGHRQAHGGAGEVHRQLGRRNLELTIFQAIVLGIVQGLAEFLPISSSGHLALVPWVLGWEDPGLSFDVALHWGTLAAVLMVFWKEWIRLIGAGLFGRGSASDKRIFWSLVVSAIPGAIAGKL